MLAPLLLVRMPKSIGRSLLTWILLAVLAYQLYLSITLGALAALVQHKYGALQHRPVWKLGLVALGLASSCVLVIDRGTYVILGPVLALCIVLLCSVPGAKQRVGGYLGALSFPLYLNHWLGLFVAHSLLKRFELQETFWCVIVGAVLAFGIAAASYRVIDCNVRRYRDAWFTTGRGHGVTVAAYASMLLGLAGGAYLSFTHATDPAVPSDASAREHSSNVTRP